MVSNLSVSHPRAFDDFIKYNLKLQKFTVLPLAGDASTRKYYRVIHDDKTWVLMEWEEFADPGQYPFISIQRHLEANGIFTPSILSFDSKRGLFLLEDLGDLTLERKFGELLQQDSVLPFYKVTLDNLAKLHRLFLDKNNLPKCTAYGVAFDAEKFTWELNYTFKNLFTTLCPHSLTAAQEAKLQDEFSSIATTLAGLPQVLCHRDFHSRNIMIKGERIYFIDFQDARLGPPQYDLVSLVHDSYVQISAANVTHLIDYYLAQFPEALKMFDGKNDFMHFFSLQMLQRCFKACGTFAAVLNQRGDRRYLKYLPHTLAKVTTALADLGTFPTMSALVENLELPQIEKWP